MDQRGGNHPLVLPPPVPNRSPAKAEKQLSWDMSDGSCTGLVHRLCSTIGDESGAML
jgi:hypothetical protein